MERHSDSTTSFVLTMQVTEASFQPSTTKIGSPYSVAVWISRLRAITRVA